MTLLKDQGLSKVKPQLFNLLQIVDLGSIKTVSVFCCHFVDIRLVSTVPKCITLVVCCVPSICKRHFLILYLFSSIGYILMYMIYF